MSSSTFSMRLKMFFHVSEEDALMNCELSKLVVPCDSSQYQDDKCVTAELDINKPLLLE